MASETQCLAESATPDASATRHIKDVQRTSDGRLFVFLKVIVDKAEDER